MANVKGLGAFMAGAATAVALVFVTAMAADVNNPVQSFASYKRLLTGVPLLVDRDQALVTRGVMERTMLAHHRRDTNAAIAELGDDYAWMHVVEEGAVEMVSGKQIAEERTRNLYEKSDFLMNYLGSDTRPLAIVGNIGLQLEVENFRNKDGSLKQSRSLGVYEIKGGKLWRLWAFTLAEPATRPARQ